HVIARDQHGILWLGTADKGLVRLDPGKLTFADYLLDPAHAGSEAVNRVYSIFVAADGTLWLGANQGLLRFNPASGRITRQYSRADGLPANTVVGVLGDRQGKLWLSTAEGLSR